MSRPAPCHTTAPRAPVVPTPPGSLVVAAPAKLNLFLEILRKRPDGYHDLESLMVAVDLFDTLEVRARPGRRRSHSTCDPPGLPDRPGEPRRARRPTHSARTRAGPTSGPTIRLTKRIPTQAGLAGGSSDAAAALVGLEPNLETGLTRDELAAVAARRSGRTWRSS